jgi:FlaA1/EpsC-like NDP-sugar epimerase
VEILGRVDQIKDICEKREVDEVLIAIPSASPRQVRRIVSYCGGMNLRFSTVPGVGDLIEGRVRISQIREVDIEDLLGRDPVTLDTAIIEAYVQDKCIAVTGAGGSIGAEMCRQIARFRPKLLLLIEQAENNLFEIDRELRRRYPQLEFVPCIADICDRQRVRAVFEQYSPYVVIHAAAHKHVPLMEYELNVGEAVKNNVLGTKNVADAAVARAVTKVVVISTDKAVNPTSVMGCTKRLAEMYVQQLSEHVADSVTQFVTVRFGNVLGSSGSVIPIFKEQISKGGPVTVTHPEMKRYFMTIPEAAQLVLQAGAMGSGGEIFVLDMGEPVRIVDLASDLITLSGFRPGEDIEIRFTGTRPGEKLYEELSIEGEDISRTRHPKIGIWITRRQDWQAICESIERLTSLSDQGDDETVREALRRIVPEYGPAPAAPLESPRAVANTPGAAASDSVPAENKLREGSPAPGFDAA